MKLLARRVMMEVDYKKDYDSLDLRLLERMQ
jgi:hypothetical protein